LRWKSKCCRNRDAARAIQDRAKRRGKKFPAGCIGLIKTSRENTIALGGRTMQMGRRGDAGATVARNFRDIGIHSDFNIENMKLFRGWLADGCTFTMKFQSEECTRARV
jgi:hypothetical protein